LLKENTQELRTEKKKRGEGGCNCASRLSRGKKEGLRERGGKGQKSAEVRLRKGTHRKELQEKGEINKNLVETREVGGWGGRGNGKLARWVVKFYDDQRGAKYQKFHKIYIDFSIGGQVRLLQEEKTLQEVVTRSISSEEKKDKGSISSYRETGGTSTQFIEEIREDLSRNLGAQYKPQGTRLSHPPYYFWKNGNQIGLGGNGKRQRRREEAFLPLGVIDRGSRRSPLLEGKIKLLRKDNAGPKKRKGKTSGYEKKDELGGEAPRSREE